MDGLSEKEEYVIFEQFSDEQYLRQMQFQATSLLSRNTRFINDVEQLKQKYNIGDKSDDKSLKQSVRSAFEKDIDRIASKIRLPGNWIPAVRDFVFGIALKENDLLPVSSKNIVASFSDDHVLLKIYGDVTSNELVETVPMIRGLVVEMQNSSNKHKGKENIKPELMKTMLIYYLVKGKKMSYPDIVDYFAKGRLQHGLQRADVGRYVRLAEEQIEKIYI